MNEPRFADVEAADRRIRAHIVRTPCLLSQTLSDQFGCQLWLKFENLQYTASFKERGALNKLSQLPEDARSRGVVAMSAGNHAQGVAYHARRLMIPAAIVMPTFTPFVKIENTEKLGARVVLAGGTVDESAATARDLSENEGLTFIHPFDDSAIIAGQGTVALEMLADGPAVDVLVVPIGGGGLISGMALAARHLRADMRIVGVQTDRYAGIAGRRAGGKQLAGGPTIAEGIAVKTPGELTSQMIERYVDDVLLVDEPAIETAVLQLLEIEKTVVEGAGAAPLAAIARFPDRFRGQNVGLVLSGGNIDSRLLSGVILRGLVRSERLIRIRVAVPDSPGSLSEIAAVIAKARGNVVDVAHQRAFSRLSVKQADIDFTIETRNGEHAKEVAAALNAAGFAIIQLDPDAATAEEP